VWQDFMDLMVVVTMEDTGCCNIQVYQSFLGESLVSKDLVKEAEIAPWFHVGKKYTDNPNIHMMALFKTYALSNTTDLHFGILDDRTNIGPANNVVLSFLTVKEEAVSKSNQITVHLWQHPTDGSRSTQMIISDSRIKASV
jgi:hypothetical protein